MSSIFSFFLTKEPTVWIMSFGDLNFQVSIYLSVVNKSPIFTLKTQQFYLLFSSYLYINMYILDP